MLDGKLPSTARVQYNQLVGAWCHSAAPRTGFRESGRELKTLNTPVKRVGFVILAIGSTSFFLGWILWAIKDFVYAWDEFIKAVSFDFYYWKGYSKFLCFGFYLAVIGVMFSYLYDKGIGKLIKWIRCL